MLEISKAASAQRSRETLNNAQTLMLYVYIDHPLIKSQSIEKREFQVNIAQTCINNSTLIVLPTGMGKTVIALLAIAHRMQSHEGKILFLAPTKPLAVQHQKFLEEFLKESSITLFTGEVAPEKRKNLWKSNRVIVSTPQVIQNDLIAGRMDLRNVSLVIFDEAHKSVGNYAYVYIAEQYHDQAKFPLTLGMTASPGYDSKKILEICDTLQIESVEIRSEFDSDVMPYVYDIDLKWVKVDIPPTVKRITDLLRVLLSSKLRILRGFGLVRKGERISTKEILDAQKRIQGRIAKARGRPAKSLYQAAVAQAAAMKVNHAIELAETQGTATLRNYLLRLEAEAGASGGSKAAISLAKDPKFQKVIAMSEKLSFEHPKLAKSVEVVRQQLASKPDSRIIVFTHYRETSDLVVEALNNQKNIHAVRFIGQASKNGDKGLRQKEQVKLIQKFKEGLYNVLVATSVAEEGLDIPATDLVVFYEPIPSEIRTIQRRGRTGRRKAGKVVILITRNTRDEAYHWTSRSKEKRMKSELQMLREELRKKLRVVGEPKSTEITLDSGEFQSDDKSSLEFDELVSTSTEEPSEEELALMNSTLNAEDGLVEGSYGPAPAFEPEDNECRIEVTDTIRNKKSSKQEGSNLLEKSKIKIPEEEEEPYENEVPGQDAFLADINQLSLSDFEVDNNETVRIITDTREFNSNVAKELSLHNVQVEALQLGAGDYIISERVAVERKKTTDLLKSLMDGRLFTQLKKLKTLYLNPILIIEGKNPFTSGNVNPNAVTAVLASIVTDFKIPIINTKDELETVKILIALAKREQLENNRNSNQIRNDKSIMTLREQQLFIVEGLPNVSSIIAQRLLAHFGSISNIFNATEKELCEVKGIGKKIAEDIRKVIDERYQ
ncbi:MAG: DEAD/DEAH box helicase [Thermoplasmata archaeon]|nr:MAG: DEAD/DEAH box helicase [Thermoplasmata archaeon]